MMATIESMVVKLCTNLTDAEVEDLMDKFGNLMKSSAIVRYKLGPITNMTGFPTRRQLFSLSCSTYDRAKRKSLPVRQHGQAQRVMSFAAHHHKNNIKQEVLQVALLRIYDVKQEPPALVSQQQFPVASDAIVIADELAKRKPERLYRVFDADMNVVYAR